MVNVGDKVTFVKNGQELEAEVLVVWTQACVNLAVEDGSMPTSVMKADYFPTLPSGHYWKA